MSISLEDNVWSAACVNQVLRCADLCFCPVCMVQTVPLVGELLLYACLEFGLCSELPECHACVVQTVPLPGELLPFLSA